MLKVTTGRHSTAEMDLVRTARACGQAGIRDARAWPSLTFPRQAVKSFAEVHKVNYVTEICGVAAGANSLRKRS